MAGLDPNAWLDEDPERMSLVDGWIIRSVLGSYDFWLHASEKLCIDPENHRSTLADFDDFKHNIILIGLRRYYNIMQDTVPPDGKMNLPQPEVFEDFLRAEAKNGSLCLEEETSDIIREYKNLLEDTRDFSYQAKKFMPAWLTRKRAGHISSGSDLTLEKLLTSAEIHADIVSAVDQDNDSFILYGRHPEYDEPSGRVDLGKDLRNLSASIGGLFRGDCYLFHSPTGGGKTVVAGQILVNLVLSGLKGIFISTEQPWKEIEPRIISSACDVQINMPFMVNRFHREAALQHKSCQQRILEWEKNAFEKFCFVRWSTDNTQSVRTDLEATIRKGAARLGQQPDFVILDWIGGAIGDNVDSNNLRFAYQTAADAFAAAADKHKFIGIATAQSKSDRNYLTLTAEQLAECKSMHRKFTTLVGITAIAEKTDDEGHDPTNNRIRKFQFFDVSKARKGIERRIAMERFFEYQKFRERAFGNSDIAHGGQPQNPEI